MTGAPCERTTACLARLLVPASHNLSGYRAKGGAQRMDRPNIIDIDIDPLSDRSRRHQTLLRIGLPLGGVGLIVGFLLGIAIYSDRANRSGVLGLSETLLHSTQQRVAQQVATYMEPAAHTTLLARSMLSHGGATSRAEDAWVFS